MKHFYLLIFTILIGLQVNSQTLVTKRFTPSSPVTVDGCGTYCTIPGLDPVTFTEADFPGMSPQVTQVTVTITWLKTAGTCADPTNGDSFHNESNFRIDSPSTQVVLASPGTWSGNASISDAVTTIFTQSVSNVPSGTPTLGQYLPNGGNLNDFNDKSALGDWSLRPGDTVGHEPMCISSYTVKVTAINDNIDPVITVCAPTPVDACLGDTVPDLTGSVTATDNVTTAPVITQSPAAGTPLSIGTTTITLTAMDAAGNTDTCTVDQTLNDITAPTVTVTTTATECDVNNGALNFSFFDVPAGDTVHFSSNNGVSYDYSFNGSVIFGSANNLAAGNYDVRVRYSNADCSLSLGRFTIDTLVPSSAFIIGSTDETICGVDDGSISFNLIDNPGYGMVEISLNGGTSYDYIFNDNAGNATINDLPPGDYTIWSRWVGDSCAVEIGQSTIGTVITSSASIIGSTDETVCNADDGSISFHLINNPTQSTVEISLNGGTSYDYSFNDNAGSATINNLISGDYVVWSRWGDDSCAVEIGTRSIDGIPSATTIINGVEASIGQDDGRILVSFPDDPDQAQIKISIDGGTTYPYIFDDTSGNGEIANLAANTYDIWASFGDDSCPTSQGSVTISEIAYTSIPDSNFESVLGALNYDNYLGDNKVPTSLINTVSSLDVASENITNLTGIENFEALQTLNVSNNSLTNIDINTLANLTNLDISGNTIPTVAISRNTNLRSFVARSVGLTAMDFSSNTLLREIDINGNSLTTLDFSSNLSLEVLDVASNQLTFLDVFLAFYENITFFDARNNSELTCIRVKNVEHATMNWNNIDPQTSFGEYCQYTSIPDPNFEAELELLGYDDIPNDGQVPTTLIKRLKVLGMNNKNISDFTGIEDFVSLTSLSITQNSHTSLDVSNLSELEFLRTDGSPNLQSINVIGLTKLEFLRFNSTNVTSIDISTNIALKELWAFQISGMIQMIDVTNNPELWRVLVQKNSIVGKIDLSNLAKLTWLSCQENEIDQLDLKNGNNTNITTFEAQDNPNLACITVDDPVYSIANWTNIDGQTSFNIDCIPPVITLDGENPQIIELGVGYTELGASTDDGSTVVIDATAFVDVVGNYTITYNATNAIGNSAVEVTRIVNVVDTTNPIAICQDINVALNPSGTVTIIGTQVDNSSSDLSGIASLAVSPSSFTTSDVGANTVTLTVTDTNGNSETCTSTVTVVDTIAPTMACQDITVQLDATGNVSITATQVDGGTTDAAGIASLNIDITDFDCANIGENTVTLTATDTNGNEDTCTAIITVEDTIAPVFNAATLPTDIEVPFDTGDMYTLADFTTDVVATDNCDVNNRALLATTITQNPVAGTLLGFGDHVIMLSVEDADNNVQTATFTITVSDLLGVEENIPDDFRIYPNPATGIVTISINIEKATIFNALGQKVLETSENSFDSSVLQSGIYFIHIETDSVTAVKRFIRK